VVGEKERRRAARRQQLHHRLEMLVGSGENIMETVGAAELEDDEDDEEEEEGSDDDDDDMQNVLMGSLGELVEEGEDEEGEEEEDEAYTPYVSPNAKKTKPSGKKKELNDTKEARIDDIAKASGEPTVEDEVRQE
jgi:hypothetical protein